MIDSVSLLKQLIACPSVTPDSAGALDIIEEALVTAGFSAKRLPAGNVDNLWAYFGESPVFVLAGHVDVVPAGDLSQWTSPPFVADERDGFIYGRGAADMKSGVAAMVAAAVRAANDNKAEGLALLITSDEEGEAKYGTKHVVAWLKERGFTIPYALVGEPSCEKMLGDTVKIGRRGSLTARITIKGIQAHVAYPQRGDNAALRLLKVLSDIANQWPNIPPPADGDFPPTSCQIVRIHGDSGAENVIPAEAAATINFRYAPTDDPQSLKNTVVAALQASADNCWECVWHHSARPFFSGHDSRLAGELRAVINDVCGVQTAFSTGGGSSDGRFLRDICGELAEFGVLNAGIHEINERVAAADVRRLTEVYYRLAIILLSNR